MIPVVLIMAITVDGFIAKDKNHFADWTSKEDKQFFSKISKQHKVIIMGKNTFDTFKKPLPDRLSVVFSNQIKLPKTKNVKWVKGNPKKVLNEIKKMGYKSAIVCGGSQINMLFLKERLISDLIITVEPKLFGQGLTLFNKDFDINLELKELLRINQNTFTAHYKIIY